LGIIDISVGIIAGLSIFLDLPPLILLLSILLIIKGLLFIKDILSILDIISGIYIILLIWIPGYWKMSLSVSAYLIIKGLLSIL